MGGERGVFWLSTLERDECRYVFDGTDEKHVKITRIELDLHDWGKKPQAEVHLSAHHIPQYDVPVGGSTQQLTPAPVPAQRGDRVHVGTAESSYASRQEVPYRYAPVVTAYREHGASSVKLAQYCLATRVQYPVIVLGVAVIKTL